MEKSKSEVTDKIRYSIKEKLKNMNTFVDNELPEYIMILIANKRSKHHMEKDLSLFLGSHTIEFTNWLWDLVNAFKAGSKSNLLSDSQHNENVQIKEMRAEEDDVLNYDPAEQGESLCLDESNESSANQQTILKAPEKSNDSNIPSSSADNSILLPHADDQLKRKTTIKVEKNDDDDTVQGTLPKTTSGEQKSAKVYPIQRTKPVSTAVQGNKSVTKTSSEFPKSDFSGVASVVCFTQKKFGGAAAALQANKLLLKAVNDATKSVLSSRDIKNYYKPTPIKELAESKKCNDEFKDKVPENAFAGVINDQGESLLNYETNVESFENTEQLASKEVITSYPEVVDMIERSDIQTSDTSVHQPQVQIEEENTVTPHFIVTLDGVKFSSLKRKRSIASDEEPMDVDDEEDSSDDMAEQISEKKQKIAERCKYWPACKNSVDCAYHHPTVPCKCFPNCKFGDKCLYIHPNCKFDALCSKKECPYTHCSVRKYPIVPTAIVKPMKIHKSKIVCKYYPRCTAKQCPFIHPKQCKFGTQCRAPKCPFGHFQIPNRSQLKWKAV